MANDLRGEIDWVVEDHTYILRLSLADLKSLQQELNIPTLQWQKRLVEQDMGMVEMEAILTRALRTGEPGRVKKPVEVAAVMEAAGFMSCLKASVDVLLEGLNDPVERKERHEKKLKEAEEGASATGAPLP